MNLLARLRKSHTPDAEALSAFLDARLAPDAARALEAHVAECDACAECLQGLRQVKSMLSGMPDVEAPRSFRVRRADIRAARETAARSNPLRWAPALSGVAAALFIAVLVADVSTQGGGDGDSNVTGLSREASGAPVPASNDFAADSATGSAGETPAAASAVAPTVDGDAAQGGQAESGDAPPDVACEALEGTPDSEALRSCAPGASLTEAAGAAAQVHAEATRQAEVVAASAPVTDEDDGNRNGFLIVEIVAAIVAVGAAVAYVATRGRKLQGGR